MKTATKTRPLFTLSKAAVRIFNTGIGWNPMNHSSVMMTKTLADLKPLQGTALLIGGMAVIEHGYVRYTEDIDLLYTNSDTKIIQRLSQHFNVVIRSESGWHQLEHKETKIRVELIPGGALGHYGFLPFCNEVKGEAGYISVAGLVWLKLIAGRSRDETDIIELYKREKARAKVVAARAQLPAEFHERFDILIAKAERELQVDPYQNFQNRPYVDDDNDSGGAVVAEAPATYSKRTKKSKR